MNFQQRFTIISLKKRVRQQFFSQFLQISQLTAQLSLWARAQTWTGSAWCSWPCEFPVTLLWECLHDPISNNAPHLDHIPPLGNTCCRICFWTKNSQGREENLFQWCPVKHLPCFGIRKILVPVTLLICLLQGGVDKRDLNFIPWTCKLTHTPLHKFLNFTKNTSFRGFSSAAWAGILWQQ